MRILMLSWEYPPKVIGGLARHVQELSEALVEEGHEVHVITSEAEGCDACEVREGVVVHRAHSHTPGGRDLVTSVMQMNFSLLERATTLLSQVGEFDIIHAHDWLVAFAAKVLKHAYRRPLVATIHATEYGRNNGLHSDLQRYISDVEWWLGYEAWRMIVCSEAMRHEVQGVFQIPRDKVRVIPNGVVAEKMRLPADAELEAFRNRYASPNEKIIFFIGRLVREKGIWTLLEAIPKVLAKYPEAKFIIGGTGPEDLFLKDRARVLGIDAKIYFTGYVDDLTRNKLYACADVAVIPSLYEPFGIVALEAMAAQTPMVASGVGGLDSIVRDRVNGMKVPPGDSTALAGAIGSLLTDPHLATTLREEAAREVIQTYAWPTIARQTVRVYKEVIEEFASSPWKDEEAHWSQSTQARLAGYYGVQIGRYEVGKEASK